MTAVEPTIEQAFALFLAAAHAVAPDVVDPPRFTIEDAPPCRSAQVWERIRMDARARWIASKLSATEIERLRRVLDAMCRELTAAAYL